jgi:hypothetical protein
MNRYLIIEADSFDEMARWVDNPANFKVEPDDEDFKFVWMTQRNAKAAGVPNTQLPKPGHILKAKYMLLLPEPLHNYEDVEEGGVTKIYERGARGAASVVAVVDNVMRDAYKRVKAQQQPGIKVVNMPNDKAVARWWIEDNRDAVHSGVIGGTLPSPQFKIVRRGKGSVDLAFRSSNKFYGWIVVRDIPVDMPAFRQKIEQKGFDPRLHGKKILGTDKGAWQSIVAPQPKGPVEGGVGAIGRGRKPFYNIGYNSLDDDPSEDYADKYNDDIEFRKHVEKIVIRAATKHIGGIFIDENQVDNGFSDGSPWERGEINYKVGKKSGYKKANIDFSQVNDIMNDARKRLLSMSGYVQFDWKSLSQEDMNNADSPVNNWLRLQATNGIRNAMRDRLGREQTGVRDDQRDNQDDDGGGGTRPNIVDVAPSKDASPNVRTDLVSKNANESDPLESFGTRAFVAIIKKELPKWSQGQGRPDPKIIRLIFKHAQGNNVNANFLKKVISQLKLQELGTGEKYSSPLPTTVAAESYSFTKYLEWRTGGR